MAESYIPILAALGFGCFVALLFMGLSRYISYAQGQNKPDPIKYTTYECGIPPRANARQRFSVGYYIIALVFLVFDVETALMYPWAHSFQKLTKEIGAPVLGAMLTFILILVVALVYIWKEGVLDWGRVARTQGKS